MPSMNTIADCYLIRKQVSSPSKHSMNSNNYLPIYSLFLTISWMSY